MDFRLIARRLASSNSDRGILAHWVWVIPVLLIVAALGLTSINLYAPSPDEFYSMYNSGWLVNGPFTTLDVIRSLYNNSPNQTPAYFIALSLWGQVTSYNLATGRVLTVFFGLLSLAIVYRLARDFVAPIAGFFAVIIVSSNAFYNFYITELRMYPLLVFASGVVFWAYLHIVYRLRDVRRRDFIALGVAVYFLVNVHAYSFTFLLTLGIYHLLFVPRNQKWKTVIRSVCLALLLFAPWVIVLITRGIERASPVLDDVKAGSWEALATWLSLGTNGQPLLPLISLVGLALGVKALRVRPMPYLKLVLIFVAFLTLLSDATPYVILHTMRYQLPAWLFMLLAMTAGLYGLYVYHKWLGALVFLWVIAGLVFQSNIEWRPYIGGRSYSFEYPPWQVIASMAERSAPKPLIIGYRVPHNLLEWPSALNYSQREHYFDQAGVVIEAVYDPHEYQIHIIHRAIVSPRVWVLFRKAIASEAQVMEIKQVMAELKYSLCNIIEVGADSVILDYSWELLTCQKFAVWTTGQNEMIDYQFFDATVDANVKTVYFADQWSARGDEPLDHHRMSYQLVSAVWDNVAQVDLPLLHEGVPRRFSIDVSKAPAGSYRLMALVYDSRTGDRMTWATNDGYIPEMLLLDEIVITSTE